jgi:hypothetical protein
MVSPRSATRSSSVNEYHIFIPLRYNDGSPVEGRKLQRLQARLLNEFNGLTFFPQPNQGIWSVGEVTYRDEIVIYRVLTKSARSARRFLTELKADLKQEFGQEEILIVEREVKTV